MKNTFFKVIALICITSILFTSFAIPTSAAIDPDDPDAVWSVVPNSQPGWGKMSNIVLYNWKTSCPKYEWSNPNKTYWVNNGTLWQRLSAMKTTYDNPWTDHHLRQKFSSSDWPSNKSSKSGRCSRYTAYFKLPENVWKYDADHMNFCIDGYQTNRDFELDDGYWVFIYPKNIQDKLSDNANSEYYFLNYWAFGAMWSDAKVQWNTLMQNDLKLSGQGCYKIWPSTNGITTPLGNCNECLVYNIDQLKAQDGFNSKDALDTEFVFDVFYWDINAGGKADQLVLGVQLKDDPETPIAEKYVNTLYYDAKDGSSSIPKEHNQEVETPNTVAQFTVTEGEPERTGYKFMGWGDDPDDYSIAYHAGDTVTVGEMNATGNQEKTLYGLWSPNQCTIKYNSNKPNYASNDITGTVSDTEFVYDADSKISEDVYSLKGFTFKEWNSKPDGTGASYQSGESIKNIISDDKVTYNLYAIWEPYEYNIKYHVNKPETEGLVVGDMVSSIHKYDTAKTLSTNEYKIDGYTFINWSTNADGTGTAYTDGEEVINLALNGTVDLYANWTQNNYKIRYNKNTPITDGEVKGTINDQDCTYDVETKITSDEYSLEGYTFEGWNTEIDGSGKDYAANETVKNLTTVDGDIFNLYTKWKPIKYDIVLDDVEPIPVDFDKEYILPTPEREGYIFIEWNTKPDGSGDSYAGGSKVKNLTNEDGSKIQFYAMWTPINYTIKFDVNKPPYVDGELAGVEDLACTYDVSSVLPNAPTLKDHEFVGWNTRPDGLGKSYAMNESIMNLTSTDGDVITLYAQWLVTGLNSDCNVLATIGSEYKVTIPKVMVLKGAKDTSIEYNVTVEGDIAGQEVINVVPDETVILNSVNKNSVIGNITQSKVKWAYADLGTTTKGNLSVEGLSAGKWSGSMNFTISMDNFEDNVNSEEDVTYKSIDMPIKASDFGNN